ncbi:MAG: hypothetical protein K6E88_08410 [Lachnospiraceae bacterium]|nr:hypothetical protein [Lachnospiraceae bacterium]
MITYFKKPIILAAVTVMLFAFAGCAGMSSKGLPKGKWCDVNGETTLEFDGSKMYVKWWDGQEDRDKYNVTLKRSGPGSGYIVNADKNEHGFDIMSDIEIRDDGTLFAYEEVLDAEGHTYRFVPEKQAEEARAVKDLSDDMPKSIDSKDIVYFSLSLKDYWVEGLESGSYSWTVEKKDDGSYESEFVGMGSSYVIIMDSREADKAFVDGIQKLIEEEDLVSHNGMFYSHDESDTEYSLYVKYESGEKLRLRVGSKALGKWCVDNDKFMEYAMSIIKDEDAEYSNDADDTGNTDDRDHEDDHEEEGSADDPEVAGDMAEYLLGILVKKAGVDYGDVQFCKFDDYDKDGNWEGFALIGKLSEDEEDIFAGTGEMWFVSENECKKIKDEFNFALRDGEFFRIFKCRNRKFIAFDEAYATSLVTYVYQVENSEPEMSDISGLGNVYKDSDSGDYIVIQDSYDNSKMYETGDEDDVLWTGHTWKPYYFYYNEDKGDFDEYDCIRINRNKLTDVCGFDLCGKIEHEGYDVNDIFVRDNGIININYSKKEIDGNSVLITYKNAGYDLNKKKFVDAFGDGENTWQASDYGGIYKPSIIKDNDRQ